jgi:hypothetical protein
VIAWRKLVYAWPDLLDNPSTLMPHDQRGWHMPIASPDVKIAVADPGGGDRHADLSRPRRIQINLADQHWLRGIGEDNCSHPRSLLASQYGRFDGSKSQCAG